MYERHLTVELERPVLIITMEGWIDAGLGGTAALAALLKQIDTEVLATFDADRLLDQRARRPVLRIVDGVHQGLAWPEIQLLVGKDPAGRDVLFLVGPEPDVQWKAFTAAVVDLALDLDVSTAVGLGAFPAPVPHTRPTKLAATATADELARKVGFVPGTIEVPAGIQAALEQGLGPAGIPAVGLWARVPHYAAAMPYPAASAALLDGLRDVTGLVVDTGELYSAAARTQAHIDQLIANSDEHRAMVAQLEQSLDATEGQPGLDLSSLPSGDEIAAELQRFLRGQRPEGG